MSWQYRIIRHREKGAEVLGIHKVFDGKQFTTEAYLYGTDIADLRWQLEEMLTCLDRPEFVP